jgi:histidinol phosphatase-like enzyme
MYTDIERTADMQHYKTIVDELHKRKIDLADIVIVINKNGYIGESTRNEIDYANSQNKMILYMEKIVE